MIAVFDKINPLILDVVILAILILIVFFGAIKGFKKSFASFVILYGSLFLSFCPWTNVVKKVFSEKIFSIDSIVPSGSDNAFLTVLSMFIPFASALAFFLLMYILLHLIVSLFKTSARKRRGKEYALKTKASRVLGAVFSLVYQGAFLLIVLFFLNTNAIGMKNLIKDSKVTNAIVEKSEQIINKKDKNTVNKIIVKVYCGNVFYTVSNEAAQAFDNIDENVLNIVSNAKYTGVFDEDLVSDEEIIALSKERIVDLNSFAVLSNILDDSNSDLTSKFERFAEEIMIAVNRAMKEKELPKIEYTANEIGEIKINFKNAGANEKTLQLLEEITEGK